MDLTKINKFIDFVSTHKYVAWNSKFKLKNYSFKLDSSIFNIKKYDVILTLGSNILIIYNEKTSKITCIFLDDIEYIQTEYYLLKPQIITTPYIKFLVSNLIPRGISVNQSNCLVIGLCLGNIPNLLVQLYPGIKRIDCVDVNELLCKFYNKYLSASPSIHVYCMDGYQFIKSTKQTYSTVFIDIPCPFITEKFMKLIDKITKPYPDRIIHLNLIGGNECKKIDKNKKINEKLFSNFTVKKKQIDDNLIYVLN
jgi:hypothetical protein